jgi:SulP family sulfate permease
MTTTATPLKAKAGRNLGADLTAGITVALVTIPDAMATAILAGVSPINGLYSLMVGMPIAALLASSQFMVVATTGAIGVTVNSVLHDVTPDKIMAALVTLTILVGVFQLCLGLLKAGGLVRYVSNAVLVGFMTGIALNVILSQLGDFTGYYSTYSNKVVKAIDLLFHLGEVNVQTTIIGFITIGLILGLGRIKRISNFSMMLALIGSSVLVIVLGWTHVEVIADIATIPSGFPRPVLPDLSLIPAMLPGALAVGIIGLVQAAGVSKSVPNPDGNYPEVSRDFTGQGAGNLVAGFFQGIPVGGTMGETAVNVKTGAKSRLASLFAAVFVIIIVLIFSGQVENLALPAIAALLIVAGYESIKVDNIRKVWNTGRAARGMLLFTFALTLVLPVQYAVLLGVVLAMGYYIYQSSTDIGLAELVMQPDGSFIEREEPDRLLPNSIVLLEPFGSLYFAGASSLESHLPDPQGAQGATLILRLRDERQVGSTLNSVLVRYAKELHNNGAHLVLTELSDTAYDQLTRTETIKLIGIERAYHAEPEVFAATRRAVREAQQQSSMSDSSAGVTS